jgi:hypothetical protein
MSGQAVADGSALLLPIVEVTVTVFVVVVE